LANTIRPTTITYPNGRVITYDYGSGDSIPDAASRIASIVDDDVSSTHLADYEYLGLSSFIEVDYTEPEIKWTMVGTAVGNDPDTGDIYRGFDRFGRNKDNYWYDYGSSTDVDRIKYGYDRNGNRLYRENTVATAAGKSFDELYGYDLIDRLKAMGRGDLNANKNAISSKHFAQDWALDATGNWRNFREDDDGAGWDLDQLRTANTVNEITDIAETRGVSWVTPVYSKAGNMTTMPKPADPTAAFDATYDAWSQLVAIEEDDGMSGTWKVAEYEYDGAKRRIVKNVYNSGTLDETRHSFYTEPSKWQVVEERVETNSDPDRNFVCGLRYVDDIVMRDRDTGNDGTFDERLYGMQDANWGVTGITNETGAMKERYAFTAYGTVTILDSAFAHRALSNYDWETCLSGYFWDRRIACYHIRHRVFHCLLGCWAQRDPARYQDTFNLYIYVNDSPTHHVDPSGLVRRDTRPWPKDCAEVLGSAAINQAKIAALSLKNRILRYLQVNDTHLPHWEQIHNHCKKLERLLDMIAECCGPRTVKAQRALENSTDTFNEVSDMCRQPRLRDPRPIPDPGPVGGPVPVPPTAFEKCFKRFIKCGQRCARIPILMIVPCIPGTPLDPNYDPRNPA